jgi:hypothetical protein
VKIRSSKFRETNRAWQMERRQKAMVGGRTIQ